MFLRIGHSLLITALLVTIGAHWAVLQSVAWVAMFADNSRTASIPAAFERTFDGKHPCPLCKEVSAGRRSEKKTDFQFDLKKVDFFNQQAVFVFNPPESFVIAARSEFLFRSLNFSPPVPPPRSLPV